MPDEVRKRVTITIMVEGDDLETSTVLVPPDDIDGLRFAILAQLDDYEGARS